MRIRPSSVHFSQDSINSYFDDKSDFGGVLIGETLDDICEGRTTIDEIPTITVVLYDGEWVTVDNRRLWVFRELERLGVCRHIDVDVGYFIPDAKLTSTNWGVSVLVRRNPGGYWHKQSDGAYKRMYAISDSDETDDSDEFISTTRNDISSETSYPTSSIPIVTSESCKNSYAAAVARQVPRTPPTKPAPTSPYKQSSYRHTIRQDTCVVPSLPASTSPYIQQTNRDTISQDTFVAQSRSDSTDSYLQSSISSSYVLISVSDTPTKAKNDKKSDSWCNIL